MRYEIIGDDVQAIKLFMDKDEQAFAEAGAMMYIKGDIEMDSKMTGGLLQGLKRKFLAKESLFMTTFLCHSAGEVGFSVPYPGHIKIFEMHNNTIMCQKDAYVCSYGEIQLDIALTKRLGAGFFGGEGFILEKITGDGVVFLHAGGNLLDFNLAAGETIQVDTGCIVAFDPSVDYDIKFIGSLKKGLFGGEGLFLANLTGPGQVLLQTLPFSRMAERIMEARGSSKEESKGIGGIGKSILGDLISGR